MRRFAPLVLFVMLAVSGLCVFTCMLQAMTGPDPHACCHGKGGPNVAVVQSHLPLATHTVTPVLPARNVVVSPLAFVETPFLRDLAPRPPANQVPLFVLRI